MFKNTVKKQGQVCKLIKILLLTHCTRFEKIVALHMAEVQVSVPNTLSTARKDSSAQSQE